jgi:hypothetical protein
MPAGQPVSSAAYWAMARRDSGLAGDFLPNLRKIIIEKVKNNNKIYPNK